MTDITDHLAEIRGRVASACALAARARDSVTIIAVSKQQSVESMAAAHRAGLLHFGESYLQEALPKMDALAALPIVWHFVGRLQANKTRLIAERFNWVHTVDRLRIAERLSEQRPSSAQPLNVLIQVNQAEEEQKSGAPPHEVLPLAQAIASMPHLKLRGLMSIPPRSDGAHRWFTELAALQHGLHGAGLAVDTLSMGMSGDYEAAIMAGATCIRIGTALFGERAKR